MKLEENLKKIESVDNVVVSSTVLSDLFGLTTRRVRQLSDEGVITKTSRGRYNLQDSIRNYIVYLKTTQDLKAPQENDDELDGDKEQALLTRKKREKLELEIAAMQGKMHYSQDVERVMNDMLANFRAKILALPTKVAPRLENEDDVSEIESLLQEEMFEVLQELSEYNPSSFYGDKVIIDEDDLEEGGTLGEEKTKDS